jgi:hypothetical protein
MRYAIIPQALDNYPMRDRLAPNWKASSVQKNAMPDNLEIVSVQNDVRNTQDSPLPPLRDSVIRSKPNFNILRRRKIQTNFNPVQNLSPSNKFTAAVMDTNPSSLTLPLHSTPTKTSEIHPRLQLYTYSFWRNGNAEGSGLAASPQYGGSQSGVIATYRISPSQMPEIAILGRIAAVPNALSDTEFAAGLRIKPSKNVPFTLSAERRIRLNQPDANAFYVAGSKEDIPLKYKFSARGFAQAGIIMGRQGDQFYDAGVRIDRPLLTQKRSAIFAGIGSWAGGQRGAGRLDFGPAIRSEIKAGNVNVHISADWRFRVAGNASPKSGPALTISSGF